MTGWSAIFGPWMPSGPKTAPACTSAETKLHVAGPTVAMDGGWANFVTWKDRGSPGRLRVHGNDQNQWQDLQTK